MSRVVIAARVSTKDKNQDPETQVQQLQAVADRHGWDVVGTVVDHRSAWKATDADAWEKRVFDALSDHRADVLMVWAMDRFTRRGAFHALQLLRKLEKHHGVGFYSLQEPMLSTGTMDAGVRDILMHILAWVAEQESSRKGARVMAKAQRKKQLAEQVGGRAKWGKGHMATSADVLKVWQARDEGLSIRAVAEAVGVPKSSVARILKQPRPEVDL